MDKIAEMMVQDMREGWSRLMAERRLERSHAGHGPWVVEVKGQAGAASFEIAVLRDGNAHGKRSYGWFDRDKLLITHNGGPCHWPLTQQVWDKQVALAQQVADELNAAESKEQAP